MRAFTTVADYLLEPLQGRPEADWKRAPAGKWTPAEIVDHVATAMENSARGFESRVAKPPMTRRPRNLAQVAAWTFISRTGRFPVRRQAPESALPGAAPDPAATTRRLRAAAALFLELEGKLVQRRDDLFVKHPVFGDLTLTEFMIFHVRHAEHHRRQIVERLG